MRYQILSAATAALVLLSATLATAQTATSDVRVSGKNIKAPKASVVAIMEDAKQALLWDSKRNEYVVVKRGDRFHEFVVTSVDKQQVVLTRRGSNQHFVLPRTSDTSDLGKKRQAASGGASPPASNRSRALLDPYPPPTVRKAPVRTGNTRVMNPYGRSRQVTTVKAPSKAEKLRNPYEGKHTTVVSARTGKKPKDALGPAPLDPYGSISSTPSKRKGAVSAPLDPYSSGSTRSGRAVSAPLDPYGSSSASSGGAPLDPYVAEKKQRQGKTRKENRKISRREFDAAVTDFHALSKEVQFAIISKGVRIKGISRGSLFHRWGFRDGDIILSVDGKPIRGVDDAAAVYAHLMGAKRFKVKVLRDVDTVILNYRFKK